MAYAECECCGKKLRYKQGSLEQYLEDSNWSRVIGIVGDHYYACDKPECKKYLYFNFEIDLEDDLYDDVHHPSHYMLRNGLEAKDVIEAAVRDPESYYHGNMIKYILRYLHKGQSIKDLKKIKEYADFIIKLRGGEDGEDS